MEDAFVQQSSIRSQLKQTDAQLCALGLRVGYGINPCLTMAEIIRDDAQECWFVTLNTACDSFEEDCAVVGRHHPELEIVDGYDDDDVWI